MEQFIFLLPQLIKRVATDLKIQFFQEDLKITYIFQELFKKSI